MNNQENRETGKSSSSYLDYVLIAAATGVLLWLTSRLPLSTRMIIIASVLPGPIVGGLGIFWLGKSCVPPGQKRALLSSLCFLSVGVGCTVAGINRFPEHLAPISATGIALLGLYFVWMIRLIHKPKMPATAS